MRETLDLYLQDIASSKPLSAEEEVRLAQQIRQGSQEARNQLVAANLRFVVQVACAYQGHGMTLEDLISAGNEGLLRAAERFDETRGIKFISYAVWWIRQAIYQSLSVERRTVRLPANRIKLLHHISSVSQELRRLLGAHPGAEAIAEALGIPAKMVEDALQSAQAARSLDASFRGDGNQTPLDVLPDFLHDAPDAQVDRDSDRKQLERVLSILDARESLVLRLYFGLSGEGPQTLEEIGAHLGVTRERVRQIKQKALCKLRHPRYRMQLDPLRGS